MLYTWAGESLLPQFIFYRAIPLGDRDARADPYYEGKYPTIADAVADTHRSCLVSLNPFLNRGLDEGFDKYVDISKSDKGYLAFEEASDPLDFSSQSTAPLKRYVEFLLQDGRPGRSFVNGLSWKLIGQRDQVPPPHR